MKTNGSLSTPPQRLSSPPQAAATSSSLATRFVYPTLPVGDDCTLAALHAALGPPDPELTAILLRSHDDADFHALGSEVAPERILHAVPRIVTSAAASLTSLDEEAASLVMLDPGILAAIVAEALPLVPLAQTWDANAHAHAARRTAWEARRTRVRADAVGQRDVTVTALTQALGDQAELVKTTRGDAADDAALVRGLDAVADFVETKLARGSESERAALRRFRVGATHAKLLRNRAAAVRALGEGPVPPAQSTTQRALDVQEGRVLVLLDLLLTAMRAAKRVNKALVMPDLSTLKSWFQPTRRRAPEPAKPPAQPA